MLFKQQKKSAAKGTGTKKKFFLSVSLATCCEAVYFFFNVF